MAVVQNSLKQLLPNDNIDTVLLLEVAQNILNTFRGSKSFIERIKQEYPHGERAQLLHIIEQVILADGSVQPHEVYLRNKFNILL